MNNELVKIGDVEIPVKEYHGQRVVTFKDIDACHSRPDGTARKRFNDNRKHFVEGTDYFQVSPNESPENGRSIFDYATSVEWDGVNYAGFIYIAVDRDARAIKVGRTSHKIKRISTMNTGRAKALNEFYWYECKDTLKAEKEIHKQLDKYHVNNEWFNCSKEIAEPVVLKVVQDVDANFDPQKKHRGGFRGDITLITESGYLMLVKSFTDDLAWDVQRQLVNSYFRKGPADRSLRLQIQQERAEAMLLNAKTRAFKQLIQAAKDKGLSDLAAQVFGITTVEAATGQKIDYRPECGKLYSAQDIADEVGSNRITVGKKATAAGLKTDEYGMTVLSKSEHGPKQVPTFMYNEAGRKRVKELFGK